MIISITLFHGIAGWAAGLLAVLGAEMLAGAAAGWLSQRFTLEFGRVQRWPAGRPHRRLRLGRRWDRPGASVDTAGGSKATVLYVIRDRDAMSDVALVQARDEAGDCYQPEWVTTDRLSPSTPPETGDATAIPRRRRARPAYGDHLAMLALTDAVTAGRETGPACDACGGPQAEHALLSVADDGRIVHSSHFYDFDDEYYQRRAPSAAMHSIAAGTTYNPSAAGATP